MDYSENAANDEAECTDHQHDEEIPGDKGKEPTQSCSRHDSGDGELQDVLRHGLSPVAANECNGDVSSTIRLVLPQNSGPLMCSAF